MGLLCAALMSAELAVVFFAVIPVLAVAMFFVVRRVGPLYRVLQGVMDQLNDALQEDLAAIRVIKAYVREGHVAERFCRRERPSCPRPRAPSAPRCSTCPSSRGRCTPPAWPSSGLAGR